MTDPSAPGLAVSATEKYLAIYRTPPATSNLGPVPSKRYPASRQLPLPPHRCPTRDSLATLVAMFRSHAVTRLHYANLASFARLTGTATQVGDEPHWHALSALSLRRPVPSGGGYYPVELYAAVPGDAGLAAGVYHHEPIHHVLERVRLGDPRPMLARAIVASDTAAAVLLTCRLWKNAGKYGNFGYHLASLDAGVVLGQLIADAPPGARVSFFFLDDVVDELLGLRSRLETVYAAVLFDTAATVPAGGAGTLALTQPEAVGLMTDEPRRLLVDPLVPDHAAASRITDRSLLPRQPVIFPSEPALRSATLALPATDPLPEIDSAARRSAVAFDTRPISLGLLAAVLAEASRPFVSDVTGTAEGAPPVTIYCATAAVDGMASGVYRYDPATHTLCQQRELAPFPVLRAAVLLDPSMLFGSVSLFVAGAPTMAPAAPGERWYRITCMLAGIALQRMCRAAAALGLGARPNLGFDPPAIADLLALPPGQVLLAQLLIGHPAPRSGSLDLPLPTTRVPDHE